MTKRRNTLPPFLALALGLSLALSACGGGGSSATAVAGTCGTDSDNPCPSGLPPYAGDYFVYSTSVTPMLAVGSAPTSAWKTDVYTQVNLDGAMVRMRMYSSGTLRLVQSFTSERAVDKYDDALNLCTWQPAYRNEPNFPAYSGQSWTSQSHGSCLMGWHIILGGNLFGTPVDLGTTTDAGTVIGAETISVPAGTFYAIKAVDTEVSQGAVPPVTTRSTTWIDTVTGRVVRREWAYTSTPAGETVPVAQGSGVEQLIGYVFHNGAAQGTTVARFAGFWSLGYSAPDGSSCGSDKLYADATGKISGAVDCYANGSTEASSFVVSGTFGEDGKVSASISNGINFSGKMGNPYSGDDHSSLPPFQSAYGPIASGWSLEHR